MSIPTSAKVIFITGCASGFGLEIARLSLSKGYRVVATARDALSTPLADVQSEALFLHDMDITSSEQIARALEAATNKFGRIDTLVNCAGWNLLGEFELTSNELARKAFEVNYWGPTDLLRQLLPIMRETGGGTLCYFSSSLTADPWPLLSMTVSAKRAVESVIETLAKEMLPEWNIRFRIILPGGYPTEGFSKAGYIECLPPYSGAHAPGQQFRSGMTGYVPPGDVGKAAEVVLDYAMRDDAPLRLALGHDAYELIEQKLLSEQKDLKQLEKISTATGRNT